MNARLIRHLNTLLLLSTLATDIHAKSPDTVSYDTLSFLAQQLEINVEIASNREQRELGLMHRTHLDENQGMLFVYPDQAPRYVWMKNTLLALDVLFLAEDGRIVTMLDNLQPCPADPCPIFASEIPAKYMLEVNAGFIKNHSVEIGQALRLP